MRKHELCPEADRAKLHHAQKAAVTRALVLKPEVRAGKGHDCVQDRFGRK